MSMSDDRANQSPMEEESCPACGYHCWEDGCCETARSAGVEDAVRAVLRGEDGAHAALLTACERLEAKAVLERVTAWAHVND